MTKPEKPVRIHSARPWQGDAPFGPADLRHMVQNFHRYQRQKNPAFPEPMIAYIPFVEVGIGHEPDQAVARAILNRTDTPSMGYPTNVFMSGDGNDVFAELDGVPEPVGKMINGGQLRHVSAEIYPNYQTADGLYHGPVLRRISLLGSYQPRQKGLNPGGLPKMVYSFAEPSRNGRKPQQIRLIFSELPAMTPDQAKAVLTAAGIDFAPFANDEAALSAFATYVANQTSQGTGQMTPIQQVAPAQTFAEQVARAVSAAMLPVTNQMRELHSTFGTIQANTLRQECETFAEANKEKLFPFETDKASDKYIVTRLTRLPADVRLGEMDAIANRPKVAAFAERMEQGRGGNVTQPGQPSSPDRINHLLGLTPGGQALLRRMDAAKAIADKN